MPAPYFDSFFEMLIVQRNAARNTLEAYRRDLTDFQTYFSRRSGTLKWRHLTSGRHGSSGLP